MLSAYQNSITDRQRKVLMAIDSLTAMNGYPPTVRDIADYLGISSPNGVTCHLKLLKLKGFVTWNPHRSRTLRRVRDFPGMD